MNNPGALRRIWLLTAQVIAIAAGVLIAWQAFGPVPATPPPPSAVTSVIQTDAAINPGNSGLRGDQPATITVELGQRPAARKQ